MEKQKKWQFFLIFGVIALTIYNVLPTIFYYCQPLKSPISETQANQIAQSISARVERLEGEAKNWLSSFCDLIHVRPRSIAPEGQNWIVSFTKSEDAATFRRFLPRAGSLIPFAPAGLSLALQEEQGKDVIVQRRLPAHLDPSFFSFAAKGSPSYREWILDRAAQIAYALAGPSESALALAALDANGVEAAALQINAIAGLEETNKALANRCAASFTQGPFSDRSQAIAALIQAFDTMRDQIKKQPALEKKELTLMQAESFLKKHAALFASGQEPWTLVQINFLLREKETLPIGTKNPLFSALQIDWANERILLKLHPDVKARQLLINEIAKITRLTNEAIDANEEIHSIPFHTLAECSGLLLLNLEKIGQMQSEQILIALREKWHPKHPDLQNLKITDLPTHETLPPVQKALSLVVHPNFRIVAYGIDQIAQSYASFSHSEPAQQFSSDFQSLCLLLQQNGFELYRGAKNELIFERSGALHSLLAATREDFSIKGGQKWAVLELSNTEQRLLAANRIDTQIHEDLIQWKDAYNSAQVSFQLEDRLSVPKPVKSPFLSNIALSWTKFFRGDERKVIHWGLDLSGGKTVQIELRDANHQLVKDDEDLKQGINELYSRVNKMGVSEVAIRQLGHHIVLDFPGSQSLSASELIRSSSMYFHVVNEKFASPYSPLAANVHRFLQEVWNEALVTHQTDAQNINEIAWRALHGETISETARTLLENGLALQSPKDFAMGSGVDDAVSKIALIRGDLRFGQNHPLLIVFRNFALEGSQLERIQSHYDPQKGNSLSFAVKYSSLDPKGQKINPRESLYAWTSRYSKEKVAATSLDSYSKGHGWRMAVLLNDTVISAPTLDAAIREDGSISGSFSQREVTQLMADLKAGSLTFTPHILSEKNVSPELGQKDRTQGILATAIALLLVISSIIAYYRFAGIVASGAVLCNLLILWAALQNIGATLSLPGIAGIILTVAMAVDANVLVFERIKEEFAISGQISSAIAAGYKKAYSAIVDSNVTTIIAALILLNFDAGPIKGFALTLIIGIVSSMFTALFMTRFFFNGWVQNPKHQFLKMANWIRAQSIDFLKQAKWAFSVAAFIILAGGYFIYAQRATIFGMDFTGGFSLELTTVEEKSMHSVEQALIERGATARDFQIRTLNPSNHLRILFATSMQQQPGKPFFNMPLEQPQQKNTFPYETNPRIVWVVEALQSKGISLTQDSLAHLDSNWTAMSGQMSDTMRNNAIIGLLLAFACIFTYITFRFEYKFAAAALICLLHDVLITIGLVGLLHALGAPIQIDLNTVAAIMTIVGYSLNDTIIIFDRIREEMKLPHRSLPLLVNRALNTTLSRTAITSGTTLLVLTALVALGGSSIFSFALVMTIGVFFGTLSSWYIASPLMLLFHRGGEEKNLVKQTGVK